MLEANRGCGILFYNKTKQEVLLFLRDDIPNIPFPNMFDILGGHVEGDETPEEAIVREMNEEIDDLRTGSPFKLENIELFKIEKQSECTHYIYCKEVDFEISDLRLNEGQGLVWVTEQDVKNIIMAFHFNAVIEEFFISQYMK